MGSAPKSLLLARGPGRHGHPPGLPCRRGSRFGFRAGENCSREGGEGPCPTQSDRPHSAWGTLGRTPLSIMVPRGNHFLLGASVFSFIYTLATIAQLSRPPEDPRRCRSSQAGPRGDMQDACRAGGVPGPSRPQPGILTGNPCLVPLLVVMELMGIRLSCHSGGRGRCEALTHLQQPAEARQQASGVGVLGFLLPLHRPVNRGPRGRAALLVPSLRVQAETWTSFRESVGHGAQTPEPVRHPSDSLRLEVFRLEANQNLSAHPQLWP